MSNPEFSVATITNAEGRGRASGGVSTRRPRRSLPRRLLAASEGVSMIEFAFVTPVLCLLALGMLDFGMGFWHQMQVGDAARAGAQYAAINGWNGTAISSAVTSATSYGAISATPAPSQSCGCPDPVTGVTAAACGSACPDGSSAGTYVKVNAQASYSTIMSYPGFSNPVTLTAASIVRIK